LHFFPIEARALKRETTTIFQFDRSDTQVFIMRILCSRDTFWHSIH